MVCDGSRPVLTAHTPHSTSTATDHYRKQCYRACPDSRYRIKLNETLAYSAIWLSNGGGTVARQHAADSGYGQQGCDENTIALTADKFHATGARRLCYTSQSVCVL